MIIQPECKTKHSEDLMTCCQYQAPWWWWGGGGWQGLTQVQCDQMLQLKVADFLLKRSQQSSHSNFYFKSFFKK